MYNIDNCILVRKTNLFPENGIIKTPIHEMIYDFGKSTLLGDAIINKLNEKYKNMADYVQESKKYDIYYETYRRTIHFCINTVAENTVHGHFDYPYAIIEPLKYHINDESLLGLRVEDTYFSDDMYLSDEAIILIPEEEKEKLAEKYDFTGLNIQTYTGDIEDAIKDTLQLYGYDFFARNNNGYQDALRPESKAYEMYIFIYNYSQEHGISQTQHISSKINYEDQLKRIEKAIEIDKRHLKHVLDSGLVSQETINEVNKVKDIFEYRKLSEEFRKLMSKIVDEVGLENLAKLTKSFNQEMIEERELRKITNEDSKKDKTPPKR